MSDKKSPFKDGVIGGLLVIAAGLITNLTNTYWTNCSAGTFFCLTRPNPPVPNPSEKSLIVPTIASNPSECSKENFKSMVETDYSNLCASLQQKKWKQADSETLNLLLKLSGIQGRRVLDSQEIKRLQCTDLKTIDNLWLKYSSNIFGFSEQNKIWREGNGSREDNKAGWTSMAQTGYDFGWRRYPDRFRGDWYLPDEIFSKVDPYRRGMLPRLAVTDGDGWEIRKHFSYLWDKLSECP